MAIGELEILTNHLPLGNNTFQTAHSAQIDTPKDVRPRRLTEQEPDRDEHPGLVEFPNDPLTDAELRSDLSCPIRVAA